MKAWLKKRYDDKFHRYLILFLVLLATALLYNYYSAEKTAVNGNGSEFKVDFFFHPTCPHCKEQKSFNSVLIKEFPQVKFVSHDVSNAEELALLRRLAEEKGISTSSLGVPMTFFGPYHFIGFDSTENSGAEMRSALQKYVQKIAEPESSAINFTPASPPGKKITLPLFGEIEVLNYSLPLLAIMLGIVDGFNPCAMWVLVYLISLIVTINDRRKIWLLVGSFLAASGILYFLFMTAWLNIFLLIGYFRPLTIIIGLFALGMGLNNIREYIRTKGALVCEVGDAESKKKTISKMERIVFSPLSMATVLGIIGLAFVINSIEFVCSSAIPAIFTQVLAVSNLSTLSYYLYILLYVLFFMLDDLIIFSLAVFAVTSNYGEKYAKYCKIIGGILLICLGLLLTFFPQWLR